MLVYQRVPSGHLLANWKNWKMALIEIVDLPNLKMVIFQFAKYKRLPEGMSIDFYRYRY